MLMLWNKKERSGDRSFLKLSKNYRFPSRLLIKTTLSVEF